MTGMDFETCVRCNIPIMSILFNNFSMAMEFHLMKSSKDRFKSTDISGNYSEFAKALGGHGERITDPGDIVNALKRGIKATKEGKPALLEFITTTDKVYSTFQGGYTGGA
jgi:thiamine pyrophosphate-dependent acetolactate synthase large subunit-like protein